MFRADSRIAQADSEDHAAVMRAVALRVSQGVVGRRLETGLVSDI